MAERIILALVALVALVGGAFLLTSDITGSAVYQQPGYKLPLYLHPGKYFEEFDICAQYACAYAGEGFVESWPAFTDSIEEFTGNTRCSCGDGRTFITRSDWIAQATYYE